jgi:aspartyl protease family protein
MDHNSQDKSVQFGGFFLICGFLTFVLMLTFIINHTLYKNKPPVIIEQGVSKTLVLYRALDNHFHVDAKLNEQELNLLIDTGASYLTISQDFAKRLNLVSTEQITAETANGPTTGMISTINILNLQGIILPNIKVIIVPNMAPDQGLLGLNVLKYFNIVQDNEQMSLTINNTDNILEDNNNA